MHELEHLNFHTCIEMQCRMFKTWANLYLVVIHAIKWNACTDCAHTKLYFHINNHHYNMPDTKRLEYCFFSFSAKFIRPTVA